MTERVTVLVIDDDPGIRDYLETLATRKGYGVHTAIDGESALASLDSTRPDIITLDGAEVVAAGWVQNKHRPGPTQQIDQAEPPGVAAAKQQAIMNLLDNPEEAERLGKAGRAKVERELNMDRYFDEMIALINGLTGNDGGPAVPITDGSNAAD